MKRVGFLIGVICLPMFLQAQPEDCSQLVQQVRAMNQAQSALLGSMLRKNQSMSRTLDQYADEFSAQPRLTKAEIISLRKSAKAFVQHEQREAQLISRFEKSAKELSDKITVCLATEGRIVSSNGDKDLVQR